MIPCESIKYNNSLTISLVRDFAEDLQFSWPEGWSKFPSSLCPKLAAHVTKLIATSLPGTPNESAEPLRDSSNRERKTFGSSRGPKHKEPRTSVAHREEVWYLVYFEHGTVART